ncbi:hypothetical protein ERO13_A11G054300v2 [Gossypium hirsutum]|nr:hypothetical protein ERO13_A11G054300v2 [Gossypium hirsutum]
MQTFIGFYVLSYIITFSCFSSWLWYCIYYYIYPSPCSSQEKLFQWILRQQEEGSRVTTADIVAYLQNELEYGVEESPMSPRLSFQQQQQQHPQTAMHMNTLSAPFSSTPISASTDGQGVRSGDCRGNLQHYHSVHHQVGFHSNNVVASSFAANRPRNHEINCSHQQNGEGNSSISNDCMDMPMHADSPVHALPF